MCLMSPHRVQFREKKILKEKNRHGLVYKSHYYTHSLFVTPLACLSDFY